eukprot:EG_transcript_10992
MPQLLPPPAPNTHPLLLSFHTEEGLVVLEVARSVAFCDVMREIKGRVRFSGPEEARLNLCGLWYRCGSRSGGPVQTQGEWNDLVRELKGEKLELFLTSDAIDFDSVPYEVAKGIGSSGGFGTVHRCMHMTSGFVFAAKVVTAKDAGCVEQLYEEVRVMAQLRHPNIVAYLGAQHLEESGQLRILMEHCPGGSVKQALQEFTRFPEALVQQLTYQLLQALAYLHSRNCVHRDIKPDNLLLDARTQMLKICDFGLSMWVKQEDQMERNEDVLPLGTPAFMPPEMITEKRYGHKGDIWSMGCTLLYMLTGSHYFDGLTSPQAVLYSIGAGKVRPTVPDWLNTSTSHFLQLCFADWKHRPDAAELLLHPFLFSAVPATSPVPANPPSVVQYGISSTQVSASSLTASTNPTP